MAKYIARNCPKCRDYFGVVVSQWPTRDREYLVSGFCTTCGYRLKGWRVILGRKRPTYVYGDRVPKVFS
jgi:C4-type Zn-finger protein